MSFQFALGISQTRISGTIHDEFDTISNVNIVNLNSSFGTTSDENGDFDLEVHLNDVILISRLGYDSKKIKISSFSKKKIKLNLESILDEVLIKTSIKRGEKITLSCPTICRSIHCSACGIEIQYVGSNFTKSRELRLFPNPSKSGIFNLEINNPSTKLMIQVVSTSGKRLLNEEYRVFNKKISIDLSNFPRGIYFINIINDGKKLETKRAIIAG